MSESNREEAFRAREIASKKMENKDFIGAQKIILKAQKLFPELDNVSQLLTICKVHCAAEAVVNGVMDWYGILQVEAGADEVIIRKQYRKLAFSLHPDKNSFAGAEEAFKLVAEAYSVLCDRGRRSEYDIQRRRNVAKPKQQPSKRNDVNKGRAPRSGEPFWTSCKHCWTKHQYQSFIMNTVVRCPNCKMNFFAYNLGESYVPTSSNVTNGSQVPTNMSPNQQSDTSREQEHPVQPSSVGRGTHVKQNGRQFPSNVCPNQQHDTSGQQGHPVQPSSVGRGTHVKPDGWQVPANVFQNQQHDTSSQQGHTMQPSSVGRGTYEKQNVPQVPVNVFPNQQHDTSSQQGLLQPSSVGRGTHVKPNARQVPANIFPNQQHDPSSQQGHPVQPSSASGGTYMKPHVPQFPANIFPNQQGNTRSQHDLPMCPSAEEYTHVKPNGPQVHSSMFPNQQRDTRSQHDELMKEYSSSSRPGSDGKASQSEMHRGEVQFSALNQETSPDPTPDPGDSNIVDGQNSIREDPSTMADVLNASASAKPSSAGGSVAEGNEYSKGNSNTGQEKKANCLYKNARRRSMPDPADISIVGNNFGMKDVSTMSSASGSSHLRRSGRRKQDADGDIGLNSYNNKRQRANDFPADVDMGSKQIFENNVINDVRQSDPPHVPSKVNIQEKGETTDRSNTEAADIIHEKNKNICYSELVSYPDPDFFNFEKLRDVHQFSVGQIWALYDHLDGMPRYYAQIKHFNPSKFKVDLAWLLYDAMGEEDEKWLHEELPVACGKFRLGKSRETTEDRSTFSHIVAWTKGKGRNSFVIYPNKGEVWALYKGWSTQWSSDPDNHRSYEYDVVEVLSSMSVKDGATVKPLVRIKGFVSLFAPSKDSSSFVIPSSELLRFSHSIPLYRTKGNEKVGVPEGFLELDNACLPGDLDAAFSSVTLDSYMSLGKSSSTSIDLTTDTTNNKMYLGEEHIAQKEDQSEAQASRHPMSTDNYKDISSEHGTPSKKNDDDADEFEDSSLSNCLTPGVLTYPDPEFHIFDEDHSIDKIERGQIWALYCDFDSFPKYYGWIRKVEREPFVVHLTWLDNCSELKQEEGWLKQDIPVSCGKFKVRKFKTKFGSSDILSHQVNVKHTGTKWQFEILPQVGEIWAIYMNWAPDWAPSRNDVCEFAIGEIVEHTEASIKLTFLSPVSGYISVFRPDKQKGVMEIPTRERLRFSHRIPSVRLTGEGGGKLHGFYELDSAAVPDVFLYRDT